MKTKELSVAEALNEINLTDRKIERNLYNAELGDFSIGDKVVSYIREKTLKNLRSEDQATIQSIEALIEYRNALKSAIIVSNATTNIEVAGEKMTVAEAIERKSSIGNNIELLDKIKDERAMVTSAYKSKVKEWENLLQSQIDSVINLSGEDKKDTAVDLMIESLRKNAEKTRPRLHLYPSDDYVEELESSIDAFKSEVDFKLNRSNILTNITVKWEEKK